MGRSCAKGSRSASRYPSHRAAASFSYDLAPKAPGRLAVARKQRRGRHTELPRAWPTILRQRRQVTNRTNRTNRTNLTNQTNRTTGSNLTSQHNLTNRTNLTNPTNQTNLPNLTK